MDRASHFDNHPILHYAREARGWCATTTHTDALTGVVRAVEHRHGYACIIGETGTGKTALVDLYARAAGANGVRTVRIPGGPYDKAAFLQYILHQLRVTTTGKSAAWMRRRFQLAAQFHLAQNRVLAVLIDDADRLTDDVLSQLHLLVDSAAGQERVLQIVLAGTPGLRARLRAPIARQVDQRIGVRITLQPIDRLERLDFIDAVLQREPLPRGYAMSRWTKKRIARKSRGNAEALTRLTREAVGDARARAARSVKPAYPHKTAAET